MPPLNATIKPGLWQARRSRLGTFENLDGEMVIVDGHFFQVRSDGSVRECGDDVLSPFAVITRFAPEPSVMLDQCPDMSHLAFRRGENVQ
jgi:alpha-acetolactate decarboxylase